MHSADASRLHRRYTRRKFVLVMRLRVETMKTDAFLYRMLPETVVAQMKHDIQVALPLPSHLLHLPSSAIPPADLGLHLANHRRTLGPVFVLSLPPLKHALRD